MFAIHQTVIISVSTVGNSLGSLNANMHHESVSECMPMTNNEVMSLF